MKRPPRVIRVSVLVLAAACLGLTMCHHTERASRTRPAASTTPSAATSAPTSPAPAPSAKGQQPANAPAPTEPATPEVGAKPEPALQRPFSATKAPSGLY